MSRATLAEKAGLTPEYVARLETGRAARGPSLSAMSLLAHALNVPLARLLE